MQGARHAACWSALRVCSSGTEAIVCRIRKRLPESPLKCRSCEKHVKTLLY